MVLRLDPATLEVLGTVFSPGEGWGLAPVGDVLWRSDGSSLLTAHRPSDFSAVEGSALAVRDGGRPVDRLNELEFDPATGLILANIWGQSLVAAIDPADGRIDHYIDLSEIAASEAARSPQGAQAVLNGLAVDEEGHLWVTGKLWPRLYRITYPRPPRAG
jgi:glutamine cyclotransferase